jgi:glycosyltransferase involved in cell wall biosynthesis
MYVDNAVSDDWTVLGPTSFLDKVEKRLRPHIGRPIRQLLMTKNPVLHSPAVVPSLWPSRINRSDVDIAHLHWVCDEMLSVGDIARIKKPIVWTLHDMWAFCGAEHYSDDSRWRDGYQVNNRPEYEGGLDLNRWVWSRKKRSWRRPMHIVTPSRWLADCVRQSALMRDWPVSVVNNAIDTTAWKPVDKKMARDLLALPHDVRLLAFGAIGGGRDPRKGIDLLSSALGHLRGQLKDVEVIIFGESRPRDMPDIGFPVHYTGHLHDDLSLRVLYSAADAMVIPSRQDNLPNTGVEALACGTPVIAFDVCGLPDVVTHRETGWLAKPFEAEDLAEGMVWVLGGDERLSALKERARQDAVERFSYPVISAQYLSVYDQVLNG